MVKNKSCVPASCTHRSSRHFWGTVDWPASHALGSVCGLAWAESRYGTSRHHPQRLQCERVSVNPAPTHETRSTKCWTWSDYENLYEARHVVHIHSRMNRAPHAEGPTEWGSVSICAMLNQELGTQTEACQVKVSPALYDKKKKINK